MCYINGTELTIAGNGSGKIFANADSMNMFNGFSAVTEINGLNLIDTSNVTRMHSMFSGCEALTSLDLSGFDTSKVKTVGICSAVVKLWRLWISAVFLFQVCK